MLYGVLLFAYQYPPTPTPGPAGVAPITIPYDQFTIWNYTDYAIMIWQRAGTNATQVLQIAVIVVILIATISILIKYVQTMTEGT